jgi:hypothetical protein
MQTNFAQHLQHRATSVNALSKHHELKKLELVFVTISGKCGWVVIGQQQQYPPKACCNQHGE